MTATAIFGLLCACSMQGTLAVRWSAWLGRRVVQEISALLLYPVAVWMTPIDVPEFLKILEKPYGAREVDPQFLRHRLLLTIISCEIEKFQHSAVLWCRRLFLRLFLRLCHLADACNRVGEIGYFRFVSKHLFEPFQFKRDAHNGGDVVGLDLMARR